MLEAIGKGSFSKVTFSLTPGAESQKQGQYQIVRSQDH